MRARSISSMLFLTSIVLLYCLAATPAAAEEASWSRQRDVIYGHKHGMALTMDVFIPETANGKGVIWVISSGGRSSRERIDDRDFSAFLSRGYIVFAVVHGSAPRFNLQDMVCDIRQAVRCIHARADEFRVDERHLGIAGSSADGTLALLAAMQTDAQLQTDAETRERASSGVNAVACFFSPTDWINFGAKDRDFVDFQLERYGAVDPSFVFYEYDDESGTYEPIRERTKILAILKEHSPVSHVDSTDPPTLIVHGDADRIIPYQQAEVLHERLRNAGVRARLVRKEGKGHGWKGWESDMNLVVDWFDEHL